MGRTRTTVEPAKQSWHLLQADREVLVLPVVSGALAVAVVLSALNGILQTALYHYAVDGQVPGDFFDQGLLQQSFARR